MDKFDIIRAYDLPALVQQDVRLRKSGAWYSGPCPFCGGQDRFSLKPTPDGWRWYCRICGDGKYHHVIDYVMQREQIDFKTALARLGGGSPGPLKAHPPRPMPQPAPPAASPDPAAWAQRGAELVRTAEASLWSAGGASARAYLHARGLQDATIRRYRLGYIPAAGYEPLPAWGCQPTAGGSRGVYLPRAIVIPSFAGSRLQAIKFRQPNGKQPKYIKLKGSRPALFGAENLRGAWLAFLTEGEFDCMLLDQQAGDLAGTATLGSAGDTLEHLDFSIWGQYLLPVTHYLAAYDQDAPGQSGMQKLGAFTHRIRPAALPNLPGAKVLTDLWRAGLDLGDWVARTVERVGLLPGPPGAE